MAKRLFVAVRPPDDVLDALEGAVAPARKAMVGPRWTARDQWHLTLQFLGRVEDDDVDHVAQALDTISRVQPFPVRLGGGGAFPRPQRGRIIWMGVTGGADDMAALARSVGESLRPLGFAPDDRPHHTHVTLARVRNPGDVSPAVDALGDDPVGPAFVVSDVVLYESILSPKGARYEPVSVVGLEG